MHRSLALAAAAASLCLTLVSSAAAGTQYSVFCANDRIEVDSRSFEQMKSARGSGVCLFGSFDYRSDALSFAKKNFGGTGASCSCR